jgi:hypothetical protein
MVTENTKVIGTIALKLVRKLKLSIYDDQLMFNFDVLKLFLFM